MELSRDVPVFYLLSPTQLSSVWSLPTPCLFHPFPMTSGFRPPEWSQGAK